MARFIDGLLPLGSLDSRNRSATRVWSTAPAPASWPDTTERSVSPTSYPRSATY